MNTIKCILCSSIVLFATSQAIAASTNVYKWTDKDGIVHYSQNAPKGQTAEMISTKTPRAALPDAEPQATLPITANSATSDEEAEDDDLAQKDPATCQEAQKGIQSLQQPIIMKDEKIMTIDEKNTEILKLKEIIKIHCP